MTDEEALREFILGLLTGTATDLLSTPEGREEVAAAYDEQAVKAHPAVAAVLREAAEKLRGLPNHN